MLSDQQCLACLFGQFGIREDPPNGSDLSSEPQFANGKKLRQSFGFNELVGSEDGESDGGETFVVADYM